MTGLLFANISAPLNEKDKVLVEQLFDNYHRLMLYIANQILNDHALAEDSVSESFIKIIRHRDKLRDVSSHQTKAYIVNIVRTTSLNLIKQRAIRSHEPEEFLDDVADENINIQDDLVAKEGVATIMKAFQTLPIILKDVAYLYFTHELSHDEIAETLNISVAASKKRLSRARLAIKKILGGDSDEK